MAYSGGVDVCMYVAVCLAETHNSHARDPQSNCLVSRSRSHKMPRGGKGY